MMEDLKDVETKWLDRKLSDGEWNLIAVHMTNIASNNYIDPKRNFIAGT
jgi:hypothetical protein